MNSLSSFTMVFLGAGIGGSLRHAVNLATLRISGGGLPVGTMAVNVVGSFLIGLFIGHTTTAPVDDGLRLLVVTGFLGGFTTFSAYSFETVSLWQRGQTGTAITYAAASVVLSLAAAAGGLSMSRW